ncbi:MAG: RNA-binding S4 domain-containing protein [Microbacteriaceae bacterium]|nr:RNA-binding S4 domain-containing protein [Microbacteriaceae bacterium]
MENVRADVWVWAARLAKTRSQATAACKAGHIKINDSTAKPAQTVKLGDIVRSTQAGGERIYRVAGFASKRGSAAEAALLFEDLTPPPVPKAERAATVVRKRGTGRPSKKERRQLDELRGFAR